MDDIKQKAKIVELAIEKVQPHDTSHKTDAAIEMITESLKEYGFQQPIVIDKNNVIIAGNALYRAALALGIKKVPCIVADHLSDEEVAQYRIADNKTSEFAKWNEKKLRQELSYLESPQSLQYCFDNSILDMLGMNEKPKATPKLAQADPTKQQPKKKAEPTAAEKDKQFKEKLKQVDQDLAVKAPEYIEYTCSNCGKLVKIKRP